MKNVLTRLIMLKYILLNFYKYLRAFIIIVNYYALLYINSR